MDHGREEQLYGMKTLGSIDSREHIDAAQVPTRTRSTRTGYSEGRSDALEAVPEHVLNHAQ